MLVINRKEGQVVELFVDGQKIGEVMLVRAENARGRIGFTFNKNVSIRRRELALPGGDIGKESPAA